MRVEQLMTRNVESCSPRDMLDAAARIMCEHDCGCVPVVMPEEGGMRVFGMLTDRDICMAAFTHARPLTEIPVAAAMSKELCSCTPQDPLSLALKVLATNQLRRLPILDAQDHLVGMLSLADIAREAAHEREQQAKAVQPDHVGETVGMISQPCPAQRDLVPAEQQRD
jgi:CBS domain-containing protein